MREINKNHIVLEGIDGSGKTSVLKVLEALLQTITAKDPKYSDYTFTFDTSPNEKDIITILRILMDSKSSINELCKDDTYKDILNSRNEILYRLFLLDHKIHDIKLSDMAKEKSYVISDRGCVSNCVYQNTETRTIMDLVNNILDSNYIQIPGLIIYLNIEPNVAITRITKRNETREIYETKTMLNENILKYNKVLYLFDHIEDTSIRPTIKIIDVTEHKTIMDIAKEAKNIIKNYIIKK